MLVYIAFKLLILYSSDNYLLAAFGFTFKHEFLEVENGSQSYLNL